MSDFKPNSHPGRDEAPTPADLVDLVGMLDRRGAEERGALSREALERMVSMSDLQLPLAQGEVSPVVARIGPAGVSRSARIWRIAAAVAVVAGLGAVAALAARGLFSNSDPKLAPGGALVDANPVVEPIAPAPAPVRSRAVPAEHLDRALSGATSVRTASSGVSAMVVALSGAATEAALQYPDLDDALAADIAPIFHTGALLDGGGTTYEDLSGEFAAITGLSSPR